VAGVQRIVKERYEMRLERIGEKGLADQISFFSFYSKNNL